MDRQPIAAESLRNILSNVQTDVIVANVQTVGDTWRRERYIHNFNRMYLILEGEGRIEVDGAVHYPQPGQIVVLPCHIRQSYSSIEGRPPFRKYWCHFTARAGARDLFEMFRFPVCVDTGGHPDVERWFRELIRHMRDRSPAATLNVRASMLQLIAFFVERCIVAPPDGAVHIPSEPTWKMSRVLSYIEDHLNEKMTVDQLAGLVHYHPNYFIRAFRSVLGCSPIQYIHRRKLDKARALLATDIPVGSIADAVGIERHNFSAMFKSYTGFSPRDFRRMLRR